MYNLTFTNGTGINTVGLIQGVNDLTEGMFIMFILAALWFIMFISFKSRYDTKVCFTAASFIISLIMVFGVPLSLYSPDKIIYPVILAIGGLNALSMGEKN
jgi:hypothetical protein